ncbi:MAG: hypothetical protein R3F43_05885 [bacterium]
MDRDLEVRYGGAARRLADQGLLHVEPGRWRSTDRGRLLLNQVVVALLGEF